GMTTKKLVIIISSVILVIGLLIALFVGAIVGTVFYSIGNSEAAATAKTFLRKNAILTRDIGEVKDFGSFITGNINVHNSDGDATLYLKVIGERQTVNATVSLMYRNGRDWRVTDASFKNSAGQTVDLINTDELTEPMSTP
ncbi:MAG TPA: cytochrome c oxidase assembly factor Coa1 family protein, partial [Pyrinomonadaceae bacterium]